MTLEKRDCQKYCLSFDSFTLTYCLDMQDGGGKLGLIDKLFFSGTFKLRSASMDPACLAS